MSAWKDIADEMGITDPNELEAFRKGWFESVKQTADRVTHVMTGVSRKRMLLWVSVVSGRKKTIAMTTHDPQTIARNSKSKIKLALSADSMGLIDPSITVTEEENDDCDNENYTVEVSYGYRRR